MNVVITAEKNTRGPQSRVCRYWSWYIRDEQDRLITHDSGYASKKSALAAGRRSAELRGYIVVEKVGA